MSSLERTDAIEERIRRMPVVDHLGLCVRLLDDGRSEVTLPRVEPFHLGGVEGAFLNGGIILAMVDAAVASVALSALGGRRCGTVEISTRIMRPVLPAGVVCRGCILRRSGRLLFVRAEMTNGGEVVVDASGIVSSVAGQ